MNTLKSLLITVAAVVSWMGSTSCNAFLSPHPCCYNIRNNNYHSSLCLSSSTNSNSNVERIEYKIYPDGRVEQKVIGVKGSDCVKLTEELNAALGEVVSSTPTEEMFEQKVELDQTLTNTQSDTSSSGGDSSWEGASSW